MPDAPVRPSIPFSHCQARYHGNARNLPKCCRHETVNWDCSGTQREQRGCRVRESGVLTVAGPRQPVESLSTTHDSVNEFESVPPRCRVASPHVVLARSKFRVSGIPVSNVGCVMLRRPRCVASQFSRVSSSSVASASYSSPRIVLAPALQDLRRAAVARKSMRIFRRLATLAAGPQSRQLQ